MHYYIQQSCIGSAASDARHRAGNKDSLYHKESGEFHLPLLSLPKALEPFLAICLHALMNGSPQQRETAADVISELALWTSPALLKPYLIKTTGPLIRVVGDRFPSAVKVGEWVAAAVGIYSNICMTYFPVLPSTQSLTSIYQPVVSSIDDLPLPPSSFLLPSRSQASILTTLTTLLDRGGSGLKAFVPQLQTTFVKALTDPSRGVRGRAALALGRLMPLSTRVDPLLAELG